MLERTTAAAGRRWLTEVVADFTDLHFLQRSLQLLLVARLQRDGADAVRLVQPGQELAQVLLQLRRRVTRLRRSGGRKHRLRTELQSTGTALEQNYSQQGQP